MLTMASVKQASEDWKFIVKVGDDDMKASRHDSITDAEEAAAERSKVSWNKGAHVHRRSGERIRSYHDGDLIGYLGTDGTPGAESRWCKV